ncbi:MAG: hypothetical protein ACRECO_00085 [Xanthobacteraceae bacterium]
MTDVKQKSNDPPVSINDTLQSSNPSLQQVLVVVGLIALGLVGLMLGGQF